jgi:hypothetical protein
VDDRNEQGPIMIFVEIHGLWNGQLIADNASVTKLADDIEDQQKQITALALQKVASGAPDIEPHEKAADFARRAGFTRLDYHYQDNDMWMVVDILHPSAMRGGASLAPTG